ncbi:hypothetical protein TNCV_3151331 [Trichonephila clavipes]|nr:hypothetical protein TNCV_3151331 [Trichonephila clavipes]
MHASNSSVNPTPLAHADNQRDVHPRGRGYHIAYVCRGETPPPQPKLAFINIRLCCWSLKNFLDGKEYIRHEGIQKAVDEYFVSKTDNFFFRRLSKLPERW